MLRVAKAASQRRTPRVSNTEPTLPPLLEAKLAAPSLRSGFVHRPRIRRALDAGNESSLTLVAAPAGYGKTTAVRMWCAGHDDAVAWVTLDAGDNDPGRLWTYVATAMDRVRQGLGRAALRRLAVGGALEGAVDELLNGMAAFESRLTVVLDDLHAVSSEECLVSIDHLLEHLPPNVRVVATTRIDPALRLAHLRAHGALSELRSRELAFNPVEAQELLALDGGLDTEDIEILVERTEGWPAALVLAGLWLQTLDDPVSAVREFGGDNHFVADYLSREVLVSLDDSQRSFIDGIAVLGEFTAELCDGVLERTDSAKQLAELERSNLFVQRLERGGWYRIHSLLAEFANVELAARDPGAPTRIQRRAAEWFRARGLPMEAIRYAAAGGDHELVADVLTECHLGLISNGGSRTYLSWARTLPDDVVVAHPQLTVAGACASMLHGSGSLERRRYIRLADRARLGLSGDADAYVEGFSLIAQGMTLDGGVGQAVLHGRRALEVAPVGLDAMVNGALDVVARALFFAGDLEGAYDTALRVLENPAIDQSTPALAVARTTLCLVDLERGRLDSARSHAEAARAAVGRISSSRSWLGGNACAALGAVLAAEGDLPHAEQELSTAQHFFHDEVATVHEAWLLVLLAGVRVRRGRLLEAERALQAAREKLDDLPDSGRIPEMAAEIERELAIATDRAGGGELLEPPTEAELRVLRLLDSDLSTRQIGEQLYISASTVHSHKHSLYHKLGVHSRPEAVARADALGLLQRSDSPG
jgi:LuxR family transcriptional regulator, maltose regulon positive regulatory protein